MLPTSGDALAANAERIGRLLAARLAAVETVRGELADGHRRIEAPEEAGVRRLAVSLCVDHEREVALLDPSGAPLRAEDAKLWILREGRHQIIVLDDPRPGPWSLRVSGSGRYLAWVKVEGGVEIGEGDLDAVTDIPLAGALLDWSFVISGKPTNVRLAFVDGDGARIADAALAQKAGGWRATLATPAKPFRLQVSGRDRFGTIFRRTIPRLVRPASPGR